MPIPSKAHGTMLELSELTGLNPRTLYRLRDLGIFKESYRLGTRTVYYHLTQCERAISKWARSRST